VSRAPSTTAREGASSEHEALVARLRPLFRYELAQIATSLSIEAAAGDRWLRLGDVGQTELRAVQRRCHALARRAERLTSAMSQLEEAADGGEEITDLRELVVTAIQLARLALNQAGATTRLLVSEDLPPVLADRPSSLRLLVGTLLEATEAAVGEIVIDADVEAGLIRLTIRISDTRTTQSRLDQLSTPGHGERASEHRLQMEPADHGRRFEFRIAAGNPAVACSPVAGLDGFGRCA
jgi:signal transduction histidine kinase